jgi:hypothetical protein
MDRRVHLERPPFWRQQHSKGQLIAIGFMIGSTCFAAGSFPPYFNAFSYSIVATTFFVGSIFFTSAALGQLTDAISVRRAHRSARPRGWRPWEWEIDTLDFWAAAVQFAGTLWFNVSTFAAIDQSRNVSSTDRLVWRPDMLGSIAFLIASYLADVAVTQRPWTWQILGRPGWIARLNLLGSVAFGASAIAALVLPTTGEVVNIAIVNAGTFVGGVCFFAGAALMLPELRATTVA